MQSRGQKNPHCDPVSAVPGHLRDLSVDSNRGSPSSGTGSPQMNHHPREGEERVLNLSFVLKAKGVVQQREHEVRWSGAWKLGEGWTVFPPVLLTFSYWLKCMKCILKENMDKTSLTGNGNVAFSK